MRLLTAPGGQPEDEAAVNLSWKSDDRTRKRISAKLEPTKITLDTNDSITFYMFVNVQSDGRVDGRTGTVGRTTGQIVGRTTGPTDGPTVGWTVGWAVERAVGRTIGRIDSRTDNHADNRTESRTDIPTGAERSSAILFVFFCVLLFFHEMGQPAVAASWLLQSGTLGA